MALLWVVEWALRPRPAAVTASRADAATRRWTRLRERTSAQPSRWILVTATLFLTANTLSTLLSPAFSVSLWGNNPGRDGFGLYNTASYYVLFAVIATRLRSTAQMWRLLGVIVAAATVASLYGVMQHYGLDPLDQGLAERVQSSFGNPLFAGSFLVLALPISLGLGLAHGMRVRSPWVYAGWGLLLSTQVVAVAFTLSRGPWVGLAAGALVFLLLGGALAGRRVLAGAVFVVCVAGLALAIVVVTGPAGLGGQRGGPSGLGTGPCEQHSRRGHEGGIAGPALHLEAVRFRDSRQALVRRSRGWLGDCPLPVRIRARPVPLRPPSAVGARRGGPGERQRPQPPPPRGGGGGPGGPGDIRGPMGGPANYRRPGVAASPRILQVGACPRMRSPAVQPRRASGRADDRRGPRLGHGALLGRRRGSRGAARCQGPGRRPGRDGCDHSSRPRGWRGPGPSLAVGHCRDGRRRRGRVYLAAERWLRACGRPPWAPPPSAPTSRGTFWPVWS